MWMLNLGFKYKAHAKKNMNYHDPDRPDLVDDRVFFFLSHFLYPDHDTAVLNCLDCSKLFLPMTIETTKARLQFYDETVQKYLVHNICEFHIDDFDRDKFSEMNTLPELLFKIVYDRLAVQYFARISSPLVLDRR